MNKLMLTNLEFKYDNGFDEIFTGVDIRFTTVGAPFMLEGMVNVNRNDYNTRSGTVTELVELVLEKVVEQFGKQLV